MTREIVSFIFVAYITTRDGRRLYAKDYGKKAFRIRVKNDSR